MSSVEELLLPELARVRERLDAVDGWADIVARDADVAGQLDRVLMCSEYVADVLARYPADFAELLASGRMHRPLVDTEYETLFLEGAVDNETENQFMSRLRRFRHREMVRIVFRDLAGWADSREMLRDLSALADTCIRAAFLNSRC